ncbi:MFS transporter [Pseudomonas putida]|uniref:MFS transporter n=1 Tax=Pseudomonas putida TaxID=303 RepID=UPI00300EA302
MDNSSTAPQASILINQEEALFRKITLKILPFLFVCYVAAYLDRVNIGFLKAQMQIDLGFSDLIYGLGAGIFFAGYFLFEVPSNLMLAKVGARKTFLRIMICWGLISASMMFVTTPTQFYVMRFLLGAAEAGFFPGVMLYLTYWFPASRRGQIIAIFFTAIAITGVIGGPLSGWLMNSLHGLHGLSGWQWTFMIEGLPACCLGVAAYFYLSDSPQKAAWLSHEEKSLLSQLIQREQTGYGVGGHSKFTEAIRDLRIYALAIAWFTFICAVYVISFWLPAIIRDTGITDPLQVGLYSAIPYGVAAVLTVAISYNSDRTRERRWHTVFCATVGAISLTVLASHTESSLMEALMILSIASTSILALQPLFWAITTKYLGGSSAAPGGIALINCIGLTGGFASPTILGWIKTSTGALSNGLYFIAILLIIGSMIILKAAPKIKA